jgi:succinate-semialdehyde dehydrogenase / glutarate-semialdehyde dehydrogenase
MRTEYDTPLALFIQGEWRSGEGRDVNDVLNPATGLPLASLPLVTPADLDLALDAAQRGFRAWRASTPEVRGSVLTKAATLIRERAERIATIATLEQGKIYAEALSETRAAAALLEFHAGEAVRIYGRVLPRPSGTRSLVLREPVGPVAAFCAWNFPVMNVVRKISPALAAGCSIIIKPSEEAPGSAIEVLRCFQDAGLPGNVAQCVFGVPDLVSRHLLASPTIKKVSFTGSVSVGKHLTRLAADTMMKTTMELGGHAPVLVFDDCIFDRTLDTLVAHKFRNAGQVCISPTRFLVQQSIYDRFATGFAERTKQIRMGNGLDSNSQMGPLANDRRSEAVSAMVDDACSKGARLLAGGRSNHSSGFFYSPTVLSEVPLNARAMNEEPFGPLALVAPFETLADAIEQANRLPYGLAAYCFTENGRTQNLLGDAIEAGMVAINSVRVAWPDSPFGGMKNSGYGSEDGPEGVWAHLTTKTLHIA